MGGTLAVNKNVYKKIKFYNRFLGTRLSADEAYLIIRGIRTLDTRLKAHYENTIKVIKFLKTQKKIKEILYPHKPGSKNFKMWKKYYSGGTGLLSILIKSKNKASVIKFVNNLELFGIGYSWGGFESMALPGHLGNREFKNEYSDNNLIRLHIGLEHIDDILEDLKKFLAAL